MCFLRPERTCPTAGAYTGAPPLPSRSSSSCWTPPRPSAASPSRLEGARAERPRIRWEEGTCARLRRARECASRRARASRRSRLGTLARGSSTGERYATMVDAAPRGSHRLITRRRAGLRRAKFRKSSRELSTRRPRARSVQSSIPQVGVRERRARAVVSYRRNTHSRVAATSRRSTPPFAARPSLSRPPSQADDAVVHFRV